MARNDFTHRSLHHTPRGRSRFIFATAVIICVFAVDALLGGPFRNIVRSVAAYMWVHVSSAETSASGSGFFSRNSTLAKENQELKQQLASLQERAAAYGALRAENDSLRSMLRFTQTSTGITAPVVSSFHASPYGTFMIAAGAKDAIATGDLVLSETGFVVGTIADVGETHTLVRTVFQAGSSVDIVLGNAAVTARGEGGGNARVEVPRGIDVLAGDTVYAPALGGHPVGVVGKVEGVLTTAEQKVFIALPVNMSLLRLVYVIPAP